LLGAHRGESTINFRQVLRVQTLARLGRAADAQALVERAAGSVDAAERARLAGLVADAWVRAGDVGRASAALAAGAAEEGEAAGWLALYAGDLKRARVLLKRIPEEGSGPALSMTALSLLARVRADSAPLVGQAFLAVARGDTAQAIAHFEGAARALPDVAPIAFGAAARLRHARGDAAGAEALWRSIVTDHANSPEAPEAELEWARALLRRGDRAAAIERFEHLILTYPRSALVPLARRELEAARAG
jgi:tetratricopeptide (TPR) repeat protein